MESSAGALPVQTASRLNPQTPCHLTKLPLELLLRVTAYLKTPELSNVRVTCRLIESQLYGRFTQEFFTKRQFMITEFSLQTLIDIAKSRLGVHLSNIMIGLDRFESSTFNTFTEVTELPSIDQFSLLATGHACEMLAEAFATLGAKSLKRVTIRNFNSPSRFRDGHQYQWRSYGYGQLAPNPYGINARLDGMVGRPHELGDYFDTVFVTVLCAVAKANIKLEEFEILSRYRQGGIGNKGLNIPNYLAPLVDPVLGNLKTMHLNILTHRGHCLHKYEEFVSRLRAVEHLRLNFSDGDGDFLDWLSTNPGQELSSPIGSLSLPQPPKAVDFPNLVELELGAFQTDFISVRDIFKKFAASLKRISLWRICLGSPDQIHSTDADGSISRPEEWIALFKELLYLEDLNLHHVLIHEPSCYLNGQRCRVGFTRREDDPAPSVYDRARPGARDLVWKREYLGIDWKHFIKELLKETSLERTYHETYHSIADVQESDGSNPSDDDVDEGDENDDDQIDEEGEEDADDSEDADEDML